MTARDDIAELLRGCQEAVHYSNRHLIELDYWGCCATNARLQTEWYGWFPTRAAMLECFGCWPIHYHATPDEIEQDATVGLRLARWGEYARQFAAGEIEQEAFMAHLASTHPDVTVHWIGTLEELAYGDTPFAREWRSEFRITGGSGDFTPLRDDEWDDALMAMGSE